MGSSIILKQITPTVLLADKSGFLQQLVRLTVKSQNTQSSVLVTVKAPGNYSEILLGSVPEGESVHKIFISEITRDTDIEFVLKCNDTITDKKVILWKPVKHWVVHVVQLSHHDPGFTDLPSTVLDEHDNWLETAIADAEETIDFPDDARYRIVIEQNWSLDHFLNNTTAEKAAKMIELLQTGQFETTALFGNMTSELCGHEVLIRALYHAFRLKRKYGIQISSAEHNDITGISWGLSRVLTDAGIKIFCPGIPLYYNWSKLDLQSFWNEKTIFPHGGPGAFWWEAPSGKRLLFWCNNQGCGGDHHTNFPNLASRLQELNDSSYPYSVIRWPVSSGFQRDNSPYIKEFAYTIKEWNEKWVYPHLISSTNAKFYCDIAHQIPSDLPVFRGELAGQDYPVGAVSTAEATAANRNNHTGILSAEKFSTAAEVLTDYKYEKDLLFKTYQEILFHDEHAWGYHFPCGPAMKASEYEKAINAFRASAYVHEITRKSIARIADHIKKDEEGFRLVVFNSTHSRKTGLVHTPMREMDNCGNTIDKVPSQKDAEGLGYLRGVILTDRWLAHPTMELVEGKFDLVDNESGEKISFQILPVESGSDTIPFAAQRAGIGSGSNRLGFFEVPLGLKRDLCFIAEDVPSYGYKTYKLVLRETAPVFGSKLKISSNSIENEYYRITIDPGKASISGIYDKAAKRELIDFSCPHSFHSLIVRTPLKDGEFYADSESAMIKSSGPVCASIEVTGSIYGHPAVTSTISLYEGIREIHLDTKILKDSTPLLDVHLAFPFNTAKPVFRYEGALSVMNPIKDYLPESYSDVITVQNWVKITDGSFNILWSSLDAPIAGFSGLWPGYVSPAHRCVINESVKHPPLRSKDLNKGWIYSNIFYNNFGTNFAVSQVGEVLFRYVITTCEGEVSDSMAAKFGWQSVTQFEQIFVERQGKGSLPLSGSFIKTDNENVILPNCKRAEDDTGYIIRLWNMSCNTESVRVHFSFMNIRNAIYVNIAEEDLDMYISYDNKSFCLVMEKDSITNIRIIV